MRCKIVRFQKLMWRNMTRSTKSQKASILHYSIDMSGWDSIDGLKKLSTQARSISHVDKKTNRIEWRD